jgi:hypothetical protein
MPIPTPEPGLVISYAYLWRYEHDVGQEEGRKDRPSVIVLAIEREADGTTIVTVLPITHSPPADPRARSKFLPLSNVTSDLTTTGHGSLSRKETNSIGPATIFAKSGLATATTTASSRRASSTRCWAPFWPTTAPTKDG